MNTLKVKDMVTPLNNNLISAPDEILGAALSKLKQSNDTLFIFEDNNFLGILTVYSSLFKKRYAPTTKVRQIMFKPMKITEDSSIYEIARYMSDEQIYMLPYLEEDTVVGVIKAQTIANVIQKDDKILESVANSLDYKKAETVSHNASMSEIYSILSDKVSLGVVAIDEKGKAKDYISRQEMINTFTQPSDKQRFGKDGHPSTNWAFDEEKVKRLDDSIHKYLSGRTVYATSDSSVKDNIHNLFSSQQEAIIIVDDEQKPQKLLSMQQILQSFALLQPGSGVNIVLQKPGTNVSNEEFNKSYKSLITFSEKMNKRTPLEKMLVSTEEPKYQNQKTAVFNSTIIIVPYNEGQYVAKAKGESYTQSLNSAMKQIEKQQRRDHLQTNTFSAEDSLDNQAL